MQASYRAVIFDMDGTIIDNMRYHAEVWSALSARFGVQVSTDRFEREFAGKKNEEILLQLSPTMSAEERLAFAAEKEARYREAYRPHLAPVAGFTALLSALRARNISCVVATAAPRENRDFVLEGLGVRDAFDAIVGAEMVARGKPHPDIFLQAAERVGVPVHHCLVFEDAVNGVLAARAAGMDACGVLTTTPAEALSAAGARWTIRDFELLPVELAEALGWERSSDA